MRSYTCLEIKEITCNGPEGTISKDAIQLEMELGELFKAGYIVFPNCPYYAHANGGKNYCSLDKNKKGCPNAGSSLELKNKFFPNENLFNLKPFD